MDNLQEVTAQLIANGYMVNVKGVFHLTPSFQRDMKKTVTTSSNMPAVQNKQVMAGAFIDDWVTAYKQFITDSNVPARCEGKYGDTYDTNKYSEPGMKAFRKAIESGTAYDMLVMATALYYKSGVRMKVAIGRYMEEGRWRSDYDALVNSAENGTVSEHIKDVTNNDQHSFTQLG